MTENRDQLIVEKRAAVEEIGDKEKQIQRAELLLQRANEEVSCRKMINE